jgi:hypothetical protein
VVHARVACKIWLPNAADQGHSEQLHPRFVTSCHRKTWFPVAAKINRSERLILAVHRCTEEVLTSSELP